MFVTWLFSGEINSEDVLSVCKSKPDRPCPFVLEQKKSITHVAPHVLARLAPNISTHTKRLLLTPQSIRAEAMKGVYFTNVTSKNRSRPSSGKVLLSSTAFARHISDRPTIMSSSATIIAYGSSGYTYEAQASGYRSGMPVPTDLRAQKERIVTLETQLETLTAENAELKRRIETLENVPKNL